jgi:hypothetical protein
MIDQFLPDNTVWVTPTRSSGATLLAKGLESGLAAIPHWPMAIRGDTLIMYIDITVNLHIIPLMMEAETDSETLAFIHNRHGLLPENISSSSVTVKASSLIF